VWKEIESGREWIVDADLKDFFRVGGSRKLLTLVAQRVADGRVLRLIKAMLKGGKLWPRAPLSERARDSARRGRLTLAQ